MDPFRGSDVSETDDSEDEDYVPEGLDESSVTEPSEAEAEDDRKKAEGNKKKQTRKARGSVAPRQRRGVMLMEGDEASDNSSSSEPEEDSSSNQSEQAQEAEQEKDARAEEIWKTFKAEAEATAVKRPQPSAKSDGEATSTSSTEPTAARACKPAGESFAPGSASAALSTTTPLSNSCLQSRLSVGSSSRLAGTPLTPSATKRSSSALETMLSMASGGKKAKLSTLEQSRQDWNTFTRQEGITDELRHHNKDGFLEKRDFLQRAEVRQWELERELRIGKRR